MDSKKLVKSSILRELILREPGLVSEEGLNTLIGDDRMNFADAAVATESLENVEGEGLVVSTEMDGINPTTGLELKMINSALAALKEESIESYTEVMTAIESANEKVANVVKLYKVSIEEAITDIASLPGSDEEKVKTLQATLPKVNKLFN